MFDLLGSWLVLVSVILCLFHHPINFGLRQLPFSSVMVIVGFVLGRHVQVLFPGVVGFLTRRLRADITTFTSSARCAWRSSPLFACCWYCSFCHGS